MSDIKLKVGITVGDINGIGIEVIIKTFMDPRMLQVCNPIIYGSAKVIAEHKKMLGATDFNYSIINNPEQANGKQVQVINCWEEDVFLEIGKSTATGGKYALLSLEAATSDIKNGKIDLLVTAPIDKNNIQSDQFKFPGHTEYLAQQFEAKDCLMLLVSDNLRVGVVTGHIALSKISSLLSSELILKKLKILSKSLQEDFGIRKPQIAVLGLNPHAGDNGLLGNEEERIIIPALRKAKENSIMAIGPYSADGFFGSGNFKKFDAVLAMYHDQGLIPFKTISFGSGVNFTAGLPIIRTSPDHGTGFDIAGKNQASEDSFRNAIYAACDIYERKKNYKEVYINPLKISHLKKEN
ncbi:MAG: 4-hydroxythreonine-4-phosphate dehydrogenase PdxA [Bacteroidetes bacterium]|nr:4-hydroxythreonine-4-phosphate dehydrogenase PdxA [Bacteroidota bacterium]HET6242965.1 4-hydroxythreonine-4-phosphate dehydrogenase PdxA [Bacteroidia bacterium]